MKKYFVALMLFFTTYTSAQGSPEFKQVPKNVVCGSLDVILKGLTNKEVDEKPLWVGKDESEKSDFAVFINVKTGAFTILQFGKEVGCILGIGYKSDIYLIQLGNPS